MLWFQRERKTMEKSQRNATNVIILLSMLSIWGHIWKLTVGKSRTNATYVTLHPHRQEIWGDIWKHTVEKSQTSENQCNYAPSQAGNLQNHLKTHWLFWDSDSKSQNDTVSNHATLLKKTSTCYFERMWWMWLVYAFGVLYGIGYISPGIHGTCAENT